MPLRHREHLFSETGLILPPNGSATLPFVLAYPYQTDSDSVLYLPDSA